MSETNEVTPAPLRRWRRAMQAALVLTFLFIISTAITLFLRNSIRAVVPGRVYRSAQPDTRMLERAKESYDVRSVINLRGANEQESWYQSEVDTSRRLELERFDLRFEVDEIPPQFETRRFVELFDAAPRPVLIHCEGGVHRSAWSAAVAAGLEGVSWDAMMRELTPLRGHACVRSRCAGHQFFDSYQRWLLETGTVHTSGTLRMWITGTYCPDPYNAEIELMEGPAGSLRPSSAIAWSVRVTNRSRSKWSSGSDSSRGIRFGARIVGPFAEPPQDALAMFRKPRGPSRDVLRVAGEQVIPPGASRILTVSLPAPDAPGWYALQFDMVDENIHWFSDQGRPGLIVMFEVIAE